MQRLVTEKTESINSIKVCTLSSFITWSDLPLYFLTYALPITEIFQFNKRVFRKNPGFYKNVYLCFEYTAQDF